MFTQMKIGNGLSNLRRLENTDAKPWIFNIFIYVYAIQLPYVHILYDYDYYL